MKVKPWHIGCLIVLVLAALYFLVGTREGLDNSSTCWDMVDGGLQDPVTNQVKFVSGESYSSYMSKQLPAIMSCFGGSFPPPGSEPTPSQMECLKKLRYPSLEEAKAACASDSSCTAILSSPTGDGGDAYSKFSEDTTIVPTGGARYPGQKLYVKKPCTGSPTSSPLPPGPMGTAGGAAMTPPPVVPASSSSGAPTYNFTCTASPVSGMVGSAAAMPTWNINQPPPGWNSKFGYANHQTSEFSGGMAGGVTSGMMADISPTSPNIGHGEWKDHKELSRRGAGMGMNTPPSSSTLPPIPPPPPSPLPPPPSVPDPASVSAASSMPASVPA